MWFQFLNSVKKPYFHDNFKSILPTLWPSFEAPPRGHGANLGEARETEREFVLE